MATDPYVETMLGCIDHREVHPCSICRVPDKLRDLKEDAYTPKSISIGLLHRGATSDHQAQSMVELKWHYMHQFLAQDNRRDVIGTIDSRLRECSKDILKLEELIRASYDGSILVSELTKEVIARKMILDGCFLLQLLTKLGDASIDHSDPIFESMEKMYSAVNDITLLENQIPFIVLKKLYRNVFRDPDVHIYKQVEEVVGHYTVAFQNDSPDAINDDLDNILHSLDENRIVSKNLLDVKSGQDDHRVTAIVQKAFGLHFNDGASGSAHILDMIHLSTVGWNQKRNGIQAKRKLFRCATKLQAAGIIISPKLNQWQQHQRPLGLVHMFDFDISFKDGQLEIPVLYVKKTTEVKWMNLIALEQSRVNIRCKYTSYALFFNDLICCKHDIKLLQKRGIIVLDGCDKSKEDLLTLFRTISKGVENMDDSFTSICYNLNHHKGDTCTILLRLPLIFWHVCRRVFEAVWNYLQKCWRIFVGNYLSNPWKIIGIVAATMLLILTIMQTYYSSRSVK